MAIIYSQCQDNTYTGLAFSFGAGMVNIALSYKLFNDKELREFINDFRKQFSDIAKISDVFLTLEEATGYKLPEGVFE